MVIIYKIRLLFVNAIKINKVLPTIRPKNKAVSIRRKYSTLYSLLIFLSLAIFGIFLPLTRRTIPLEILWKKLNIIIEIALQSEIIQINDKTVRIVEYLIHLLYFFGLIVLINKIASTAETVLKIEVKIPKLKLSEKTLMINNEITIVKAPSV